MPRKVYPIAFKREVVQFYKGKHTVVETIQHYGIGESTLFEWKKQYENTHFLKTASTGGKQTCQSQMHQKKVALMLEVLQACSCGVASSIDEKLRAIDALRGQYSIHVLCEALKLPRGTYYNRKRRKNTVTQYEENDNQVKPLIRQIFLDSKKRFGRKPIRRKLLDLEYTVGENRIGRLMKVMGLEIEPPIFIKEHLKPFSKSFFPIDYYSNLTSRLRIWCGSAILLT